MKTKLKSLSQEYVYAHSDMKTGILGRDQAVMALKAIIKSTKNKKLLKSIDNIKPGKNPHESLQHFLEWLAKNYASLYFRAKEGEYFFGYLNCDDMKTALLPFPMDFLPSLGRINRKLSNLALRACYSFAQYHGIGEPSYGNRLYNDDWIIDSLVDQVEGERNPSRETAIEMAAYGETLQSYLKERPGYLKRFNRYAKIAPDVDVISKEIDQFECDERLQFVIDVLRAMMDICGEKSITEYSNEAMEIFMEVNGGTKDSDGYWSEEDGHPLSLEDRIMFCWGGTNSNGQDYVFYEIESAANSFAGEWGYAEYSVDRKIKDSGCLDELLEGYGVDTTFFNKLEALWRAFDKMRDKIVLEKLENQIKDELRQQLLPNQNTEDLFAGTFNRHLHRSA